MGTEVRTTHTVTPTAIDTHQTLGEALNKLAGMTHAAKLTYFINALSGGIIPPASDINDDLAAQRAVIGAQGKVEVTVGENQERVSTFVDASSEEPIHILPSDEHTVAGRR